MLHDGGEAASDGFTTAHGSGSELRQRRRTSVASTSCGTPGKAEMSTRQHADAVSSAGATGASRLVASLAPEGGAAVSAGRTGRGASGESGNGNGRRSQSERPSTPLTLAEVRRSLPDPDEVQEGRWWKRQYVGLYDVQIRKPETAPRPAAPATATGSAAAAAGTGHQQPQPHLPLQHHHQHPLSATAGSADSSSGGTRTSGGGPEAEAGMITVAGGVVTEPDVNEVDADGQDEMDQLEDVLDALYGED